MVAMCFQLTLYCWFGNEVTLKAAELPLCIWQSEWIEADNDFKKSMILTMMRAKKPLYLTVGNFAPLTLSTFIVIIKGSYSFFTVIKSTGE
uniref:Odorant receptor 34 n=1 Tax=Apriona germarii TaxID=157307 RepID=A0A7G7WND2_APRGE|nr:odorant receptor 34 [Apriona germarii]